jgi:uncharacterized protein
MLHRSVCLTAVLCLLFLVAAATPTYSADAAPAGKIKLLMVYNGGHDFKGFQPIMTEVLKKTGDFEVTVAENFDALKADNIKKFDEVLFYGSGGDFTDPAQEKGLEEFVKKGGAMAGVHATDAHKKSDVYWRLIGGRFTTHGGGKFTVYITDEKSPVTAGMKDFEISDETYDNKFHPDAKIQSLGRMNRGNEKQSMVWVQQIDKGRMFNTTLGHDKNAWVNPEFQRLVVRGLYWAAGREPKNP